MNEGESDAHTETQGSKEAVRRQETSKEAIGFSLISFSLVDLVRFVHAIACHGIASLANFTQVEYSHGKQGVDTSPLSASGCEGEAHRVDRERR